MILKRKIQKRIKFFLPPAGATRTAVALVAKRRKPATRFRSLIICKDSTWGGQTHYVQTVPAIVIVSPTIIVHSAIVAWPLTEWTIKCLWHIYRAEFVWALASYSALGGTLDLMWTKEQVKVSFVSFFSIKERHCRGAGAA